MAVDVEDVLDAAGVVQQLAKRDVRGVREGRQVLGERIVQADRAGLASRPTSAATNVLLMLPTEKSVSAVDRRLRRKDGRARKARPDRAVGEDDRGRRARVLAAACGFRRGRPAAPSLSPRRGERPAGRGDQLRGRDRDDRYGRRGGQAGSPSVPGDAVGVADAVVDGAEGLAVGVGLPQAATASRQQERRRGGAQDGSGAGTAGGNHDANDAPGRRCCAAPGAPVF